MLSGAKILFLCPKFHLYPNRIKEEMERKGGFVEMYHINTRTPLSTFLLNISKGFYNRFRGYEQNRILKKTHNQKFNYIFIQAPFYLSASFLQKLKKHHSNAIFINYNWDSYIDVDYTPQMQYFDRVISFDRNDCADLRNVHYLPLFYTRDFSPSFKKQQKYDLAFIGGIGTSDFRYEFLQQVQQKCDTLGLRFYRYMYMPYNYFLKSLFKGKLYKGVRFKKISLRQISEIYSMSDAIVDYNNPKQAGLTMRTFEVLGSGCKLITTNSNIHVEPFFDLHQIRIINREGFELDPDFIKNNSYTAESFSNYSLSSWVENIFKIEKHNLQFPSSAPSLVELDSALL